MEESKKIKSYALYIEKLKEAVWAKGFTMLDAGCTDNNYYIYKVIINPKGKKCICICAAIHGNERSGPFALLELMKKFDTKKYRKLKVVMIPVANPYGFDKRQHRNAKNININRHFCEKKLTDEAKILYETISEERPSFFVSLHEDDVLNGAYVYGCEKGNGFDTYKKILNTIGKENICKDKMIHGHKAINGIIINSRSDGSLEERIGKDGASFSACLEISDKLPWKKRIQFTVKILNKIIKIANGGKYDTMR